MRNCPAENKITAAECERRLQQLVKQERSLTEYLFSTVEVESTYNMLKESERGKKEQRVLERSHKQRDQIIQTMGMLVQEQEKLKRLRSSAS